jgi:carboxymethylenebutenolidase
LAEQGFAALTPGLYRGKVAQEPDEARKLVMEFNREQAMKDIQGAVNYLVAQPFVAPKKAGVMGFCMGGGLAAVMSYKGRDVGAVAVFYGGRDWPDEVVTSISAPFLGLYGEADQSIPLSTIEDLRHKLQAYHKPHEIVVYPGAPHAFFNEERPSYRPEAAADAWKRTLDWFRRYLEI